MADQQLQQDDGVENDLLLAVGDDGDGDGDGGLSGRLISDADEETAWQQRESVVQVPADGDGEAASTAAAERESVQPAPPLRQQHHHQQQQLNLNDPKNLKEDEEAAIAVGNVAAPQPVCHPPFYPEQVALQQQQQQQSMMFPQHSPLNHPSTPSSDMIRYYEAQMRDHAAAYASAAAGAAWAAAQWASQAADYAAGHHHNGVTPPPPPPILPFFSPQPYPSHTGIIMAQPYPPPHHGPLFYPPPQHPPFQPLQRLPRMQEDQTFDPQQHLDQNSQNYNIQHRTDQNQEQDYEIHRRKRQQRFRTGGGSTANTNKNQNDQIQEEGVPREIIPHHRSNNHHQSNSQYAQRGRTRRRLRSDNDSSSSGSSFPQNCKNTSILPSRRHHPSKKKKARSDESIIGKTAVSALYEYCGRRRCFPAITTHQFHVDEFECIVHLNSLDAPPGDDPKELGRGRGSNKSAAKQEASRRALEALLPGVVFDSATLVAALPAESTESPVAAAHELQCNHPQPKQVAGRGSEISCVMMDDLAPHLAKQLAIDSSKTSNKRLNSNCNSSSNIPNRRLGGYPSTTTSEGDDPDGDYYSSRGASVCSQLLYAIVQIDRARIVEPPNFTYQITSSIYTNDLESPKTGHEIVPGLFGPRGFGSLTCTGRLKVVSTAVARKQERDPSNTTIHHDEDQNEGQNNLQDETTEEFLEAAAVGSTKREARHVAAAKLLALLFPECGSDMAKVKAAAEAMRERYAAQKALKQNQSSDSWGNRLEKEQWRDSNGDVSQHANSSFALKCLDFAKSQESDPSLPESMVEALQGLLPRLEYRSNDREQTADAQLAADAELLASSVSAVALSDNQTHSPCRGNHTALGQLNRQKQRNALVEAALQNFNDHDEGGRTIPDDLTENDVGRTILRRAQPNDLPHIRKLLLQCGGACESSKDSRLLRSRCFDAFSPGVPAADPTLQHSWPLTVEADDGPHVSSNADGREADSSSARLMTRLTSSTSSSSSIVLLLCRAIAPHDEDPLGCALLTMRFSMNHGRTLCLVSVATEPHLPRERFLECLQDFATCMRCHFRNIDELTQSEVDEKLSQPRIRLAVADFVTILESHVAVDEKPRALGDCAVRTKRSKLASSTSCNSLSTSQLPTLLEEQPSEDDASSVEKRMTGPPRRQPSKRSRVS